MTKEERIKDFWSLCTLSEYPSQFDRRLDDMGFFIAPASTKYHGAYEGGLYDHSAMVTKRLIELTDNNNLKWQRPESPFIVGMFHDLCKCDQYVPIVETKYSTPVGSHTMFAKDEIIGYEYNTKTDLKGHGAKSLILLGNLITFTEEEMLCIRYHMGAYEKEEWAEFDQAIKKTNGLCLWVHVADQLASKIDGI